MAAASMMEGATTSHSLWLRGTPLGWASVPDVQQMVKTSFAVTCAADAARFKTSLSVLLISPCGRSSQTMTSFKAACSVWRRVNMFPAKWGASILPMRAKVIAATAAVVCSTWPSSCSRYCTGTGETIMPSRAQLRYTTNCSTQLGSCITTMSSRATPLASNCKQKISTSTASCAQLSRRCAPYANSARLAASTTASASGCCATFLTNRSQSVTLPHQPREV